MERGHNSTVDKKQMSRKRGEGILSYSIPALLFLFVSGAVANLGSNICRAHIHSFPIKEKNTLYNMWDVNWVTKHLQGHEQNKSLHKDGLLQ